MRPLLVEDDRRLSELIAGGLRRAGFSVDERRSFEDAIPAGAAHARILLDVGPPSLDEDELLARLRERAPGARPSPRAAISRVGSPSPEPLRRTVL
jgi:DNA-binding response OmpR family regulator